MCYASDVALIHARPEMSHFTWVCPGVRNYEYFVRACGLKLGTVCVQATCTSDLPECKRDARGLLCQYGDMHPILCG